MAAGSTRNANRGEWKAKGPLRKQRALSNFSQRPHEAADELLLDFDGYSTALGLIAASLLCSALG